MPYDPDEEKARRLLGLSAASAPAPDPDEEKARALLSGTAFISATGTGPIGASTTIETGTAEAPTDEPGVTFQPDPSSPASMVGSFIGNIPGGLLEQIKSIIPGTDASQRSGEGLLSLLKAFVPGTRESQAGGQAIMGLPGEIAKRLKGPTLMNPEQVTDDLRNLSTWIAKHPADALGLLAMIPGAGAVDPLAMVGRGAGAVGRSIAKGGKPVLSELSGVSPGSLDIMADVGRTKGVGPVSEAFESSRTSQIDRNILMSRIEDVVKGVSEAKSQNLMDELQGRVLREVQAGGRQDRAAKIFAQAVDPQFGPESVLNTVRPALKTLEEQAATTYTTKMSKVPNAEVGWGNIRRKFLEMLDKEGLSISSPESTEEGLAATMGGKARAFMEQVAAERRGAGEMPAGGKVMARDSRYQLTPEDQAKWQLLYDALAQKQDGSLKNVDRFKQAVWELREKIPNKKEAFAGRLEQLYGDVRAELGEKGGVPYEEAQAAWREWKDIQEAARNILSVDATNPETTITKLRGAGIPESIRGKVLAEIQKGTPVPLEDMIRSLETQRDLKGMFQGQSVRRLPWDKPLTPEQQAIVDKFAQALLPQDEYDQLVRNFGKESFGQKLLNRIQGITQTERIGNAPAAAFNEPTGLRKLANIFLNPTEDAVHNAVIEAVLKEEPYLKQKIAGQEFNPLFSGNYLARRIGAGTVLGLSAFWQPWVLPILPLLSPRLTGFTGTRAISGATRLQDLLKYVPEHTLVRMGALGRVMQEMRPESPIKQRERRERVTR